MKQLYTPLAAHVSATILTVLLLIICPAADTLPEEQSALCLPEVHFIYDNSTHSFCLNSFCSPAENDSCIQVRITLKKIRNATVCFSRNAEKKWSFDSLAQSNETQPDKNIRVTMTRNESGALQELFLFAGDATDSSSISMMLKRQFDIPVNDRDTQPSLSDFLISRTSFSCVTKSEKPRVYYAYDYELPVGYMRKEPQYNYPELKMFHYGSSVHMPSTNTIWERGQDLVEYHLLTAHEHNEIFERTCTGPVRWIPPKKEKKERKKFFTIRPIQ